ncbi:MAG TPA: hypothetical protein VGY56_14120 [Verrucomicrobiae bacterium]|nr:hypothetical protein [Verrucomicrobiae bacterium]
MSTETPHLQIRVHRLDGSISSFVQGDLEISKRILDGFDPMNIFTRPRIVLGDRNSHTVIPAAQITRVDLEIDPNSSLSFVSDLVEGVELMPAEFEALAENLARDNQWKHLGELDAFVVTFLNVEMADGRSVLLTMEVDAVSPQGLCELRDFLLSRPSLCFRASSGGIGVLNLANLCSLTISPGTDEPPADVWHVRRSDETQPTNPEDRLIADIAPAPSPVSSSPGPLRNLRIKRL